MRKISNTNDIQHYNSTIVDSTWWFNMSGSFKINIYWTYNAWYSITNWEWFGFYDKYLVQYTCSYEWNNTKLIININMFPNDDSAEASYILTNISATWVVQSCYIDWNYMVFNFMNWIQQKISFDLVNRTFSSVSYPHSTTWTLINNTDKQFLWYHSVSYLVASWSSWSWYTIHPYMNFSK